MTDSEKPCWEQCAAESATRRPRPLWAPWRIEYIRGDKSDGCFICDLAHGEEPEVGEMVVARGEASFVIMNAYPYNSGHVLIAPYSHVPDLAEVPETTVAEIMRLTMHAKKVMARLLTPDGFNFGFNFGAAAGAGLAEHVHGHLVPRWYGDTNFMPVIGDVRVMPEALAATARLLRDGWHDESQ
jgi:ATP adenylyltransferase